MNTVRLETMSLRPVTPAQKERAKAADVANQFEAVFVKTFVQSLRQTASIGGESMFGKGPGADTYASWFDQNIAEELSRSGGIGIAAGLMTDMERYGAIDRDVEQANRATRAADSSFLTATKAKGLGGLDVVL